MITILNLTLQLGKKLLLDTANLVVHNSEKIGLIGRNGSGKSSLFNLLLNTVEPNLGEVLLPKNLSISTLKQETPALHQSAIDYVLDGDNLFRELEQALLTTPVDTNEYHSLQERFEAIDGYRINSKACELLHGLGFSDQGFQAPVKSFSGGWRMRLNLAQCLMTRASLLLLDEPTNHLDFESLIWLERYLKSLPVTYIIISHDKTFLNNLCSTIIHIENKQLNRYQGNYNTFERLRAEKLELQQKTYQKQQKHIEHMMKYVERFRAKSSKARQAQSRLKAIEKIEQVAKAHIDSPFNFEFAEPDQCASPILQLKDASIGYENIPLLTNVNLSIQYGERIAFLGPNGQGKSTLLKVLAEKLNILDGEFNQVQHHLNIAYFAQHQLEQLSLDNSPLWHLQMIDPNKPEQQLRNYLGGFGFNGDMATSPVAPFSGGEKTRLVLAMKVFQKPNCLLLDEPSNHLDIEMRDALTLALQSYQGSLILISHDRQLLETNIENYYIVNNGGLKNFEHDLDRYQHILAMSNQNNQMTAKEPKKPARDKKTLNRLKKIEQILEQLQKKKALAEADLSDNSLYGDQVKLNQTLKHIAELQNQIDELEDEWLSLQDK